MQRGIFSFFSQNLGKRKSSKEVAGKVNQEISQGQIPIDLDVYTIPSGDYSASSGTIYLPSNGVWLVIGTCGSSTGFLTINTETVFISNTTLASSSTFNKVIQGNSFVYGKTSNTIYSINAIKLRNQ